MSLDPSEDVRGPTDAEIEAGERRRGSPDRRHYTPRQRVWLWLGRGGGYRDVWLLVVTFFVWLSFQSLKENRVEATLGACTKSNEQTAALNELTTALQGLVLASAALPGDKPTPTSDPIDPTKWRTITAGPLSEQLTRQFPGIPTAQQRLDQARANADKLEARKVTPRDCGYEVDLVRGDVGPTPTPSSSP